MAASGQDVGLSRCQVEMAMPGDSLSISRRLNEPL